MQWFKKWRRFKHEDSIFCRSSRRSQKPPAGFKPHLEHLENKILLSVFLPTYKALAPKGHGSEIPAGSATPPISALAPAQLRTAYSVNGITFAQNGTTISANGAGETIAIVDAYDDPSIAADLTAFDQQYSLQAPASFTKVGINSVGSASTTSFPKANQSWAGEIELDVEWAHAIAPAASLLLVEANSASDSALMSAVDYARKSSGVAAVSMSWGSNESSGETVDDSHFTTPSGHAGVTFIASSGDSSWIGYPSISSHVVSVGGTALSVDGSGNYVSENAWTSGGGGLSQYIAAPSYQANLVIHSGATVISAGGMRAGPDVASDADPNTGVAVYGSYGFGGWAQLGGTSAGAPVWAGLMALVDQGRATAGLSSLDGFTQTLPAIYALPSTDFHDVTNGSNGNGTTAGAGFDLVTGRGTPIARLLVPALVGNTGTAAPPTVASAAKATYATSTTTNLSVLGADAAGEANLTYTWMVTGTPPGNVTFSVNGTNGSKNSIATFSRAGSYTFQVKITDPSNLSVTSQVTYTVSQVTYTVSQVSTSVSVSPTIASVAVNSTRQFSATTLDQFGVAIANQPASFIWSLASGSVGSLSAGGLYTAPASAGTATILARTGGLSGSASVSIVNQAATTTTLTASPVSYYWGYAVSVFTVHIYPPAGAATPTGSVELFYNGQVLGTATIQIINGVATAQFTVDFYAYGSYAFTAKYMGSSTDQASTSNPVTVNV